MKSKVLMLMICLQITAVTLHAQNLIQAEYFVDADPGVGNAYPISFAPGDSVIGDFYMGLSDLPAGFHNLYIRVKDSLRRWGVPMQKPFYIYPTQELTLSRYTWPITQAEYFFDTDPGTGNGTAIPLIRGDTVNIFRYINMNELDTGVHRLWLRSMDEKQHWGIPKGIIFHVDTSTCAMPVAQFTFDTIPFGNPVHFVSLSSSTTVPEYYAWDINNDGNTDYTTKDIVHTFTTSGVYPVRMTVGDSGLCKTSIIRDVVTGPMPDTSILVAGNTIFCKGDSAILTSDNYTASASFQWSTGATTQSITAKKSGLYYVWVKNSYGITVKSEVVQVVVHPIPNVELTLANPTGGNANGMAALATSGGSGNYNIQWSNGSNQSVLNNLLPGAYSVTVDDGHCPVVKTGTLVNISVTPGNLVNAEYFFDADPGVGNGIPLNIRAGDTITFPAAIPVEGLSKGFHVVCIRAQNTAGAWGLIMTTRLFISDTTIVTLAARPQPPLNGAEYFLDTDPGVGKGQTMDVTAGDTLHETQSLQVTSMGKGFHRLWARAKDQGNKWSIYSGLPFYVFDDQKISLSRERKSLAKAEYFFDTDPGLGKGISISFNINDTVDILRFVRVGNLSPGEHRLYIRAMDETDRWGIWSRQPFIVNPVNCTCPLVDFTTDTVPLSAIPTTFTAQCTNLAVNAKYEWDFTNDGIIDDTIPNPVHLYGGYGIYPARLTVRNSEQCFASVLHEVAVSPAIDTALILNGLTTFCAGDSLIISAQPGYIYHWNTGAVSQAITVKQAGMYYVRLNNQYGLQAFSRKISVIVNGLPVVNLTTIHASGGQANGTAICNVSGGTGVYTYNWSTGGTLSVENNIPAGDQWVMVSDGRCPVTRYFHIDDVPVVPGNIVRAEYFFDASDPGVGNGLALNISAGDTVMFETFIPLSSLTPGYHRIHIRAADLNNRWSNIRSTQFYLYSVTGDTMSNPQPPLVRAEYFFDRDPGAGNGLPVAFTPADSVDMGFPMNVNGLTPGFHRVYVRTADSLNKWSMTNESLFYLYPGGSMSQRTSAKIVYAEYFFDADPGVGHGQPISFSPAEDTILADRFLQVNGLDTGDHRFFIRVKDEAGLWSIYKDGSFHVSAVACTMPVAGFSADTVVPGMATHFTNNSSNLTENSWYQWDIDNDGTVDYTTKNIIHQFPGSGYYVVKMSVFNSQTCVASVIKQVLVGPVPDKTIAISGSAVFCKGDSVILTASPGYLYRWWPSGATNQSVTVKISGNWYCWLKTQAGIEIRSETVNVEVHDTLQVVLTVTHSTGGEGNGSAVVTVSGGTGNYQYAWSDGQSRYFANHLAAGNYAVTVSDGHCPVVKTFEVLDLPVMPGNIVAAEYFFDQEPDPGNGLQMNIPAGDTLDHFEAIPVTGLSKGHHRVLLRVKDTEGRWSMLKDALFFVYDSENHPLTWPQPPVRYAESFIDLRQEINPDPGVGHGVPVNLTAGDSVQATFGASVDSLSLGFHQIYARVSDSVRKWSHFLPGKFYVFDTTHYYLAKIQPDLIAAEYFFDQDPGVGQGIAVPVSAGNPVIWSGNVNLGMLSPGQHYIYFRVKDMKHKWSIPMRAGFTIYICTQPHANFNFEQVCLTTPITFTDLSTNVDPAAVYEWDFNNDGVVDDQTYGTVSHLYSVPGIYQCKLKITHNVACRDSITKNVIFPFVHLPGDTTIYTDQSMVLDGGVGYSYQWSTGETTQTITVNGSTAGPGIHTYSVTVTNSVLCNASDTINIAVILPPRDLIVESATMIPSAIPAGGDTAELRPVIKNIGIISAVPNIVNFFLSTDSILSYDDQLLGFGIVNALPAGASTMLSVRIWIPPGNYSQSWYIHFKADASNLVSENNEDNNLLPLAFSYDPLLIPINQTLQNQTITNGQILCFNALNTITVAGSGTIFQVESGGSVTFIAGEKIRFLPGMKVFQGGYLHGYINDGGDYCYAQPTTKLLVLSDTVKDGIIDANYAKGYIFPNPTSGEFTFMMEFEDCHWPVVAQIYNAFGVIVNESVLKKCDKHSFNLLNDAAGLYFLVIRNAGETYIFKVIKN